MKFSEVVRFRKIGKYLFAKFRNPKKQGVQYQWKWIDKLMKNRTFRKNDKSITIGVGFQFGAPLPPRYRSPPRMPWDPPRV